jgi:tRNA(Ile)-lysidine synthase
MALLHVMARLREQLGIRIAAHGVDHGLRAAAAGELDRAEAFARALDVPFARTILAVGAGANLQARARAARYAALRSAAAAAGAARIATAHHADDRAETVLLRLLRGAGPTGLAVLPPRAGDRIRPFIHASSAAIRAHVERHAVPFSLDPSNDDPRFLRVRVRHELVPLLRALSPTITEHLCALADQLESARSTDREAQPIEAAIAAIAAANPPLAPRSLARATRVALTELSRQPSEKRRVLLPGGLVALYDRTQLRVVVRPDHARNRAKSDPDTRSTEPTNIAPEAPTATEETDPLHAPPQANPATRARPTSRSRGDRGAP